MEIMSRAVIKTRTLKPLPGEITPAAINNATLPVKIEAARRAIALCTDLPELLRYKSQAEGLAAAVRTIKEVGPEMIRAANELVADAWRKGGELLSQYSNKAIPQGTINGEKRGLLPSSRRKIIDSLGIHTRTASQMVRVAKAPIEKVYKAVQTRHSLEAIGNAMPRVSTRAHYANQNYSEPYKQIVGLVRIGAPRTDGLYRTLSSLKGIDLKLFQHLTPDERKVIKVKITEIMELLDEMDRLCR